MNTEILQVGPVIKHQPDSALIKGFSVDIGGFRKNMSFLLSSSVNGLSVVSVPHLTCRFSVNIIQLEQKIVLDFHKENRNDFKILFNQIQFEKEFHSVTQYRCAQMLLLVLCKYLSNIC